MIIGHGDIANVLTDRKDITFFASGVSNSKETNISEFERELKLLLQQDQDRQIVYFSSLSVFYANTPYVKHKRTMESTIKIYFPHYTILRIGNITWGTNPNTLINYFRNKIKNKEKIHIEDVYRYLIDKDEFLHWISMIPKWNCEMNITGKRLKVKDIVKLYGHSEVHTG